MDSENVVFSFSTVAGQEALKKEGQIEARCQVTTSGRQDEIEDTRFYEEDPGYY